MKLVRVKKNDVVPEGNKREIRLLINGLANRATEFSNDLKHINDTFDGKFSVPIPTKDYYDTAKSYCDHFEKIMKKYLSDIAKKVVKGE